MSQCHSVASLYRRGCDECDDIITEHALEKRDASRLFPKPYFQNYTAPPPSGQSPPAPHRKSIWEKVRVCCPCSPLSSDRSIQSTVLSPVQAKSSLKHQRSTSRKRKRHQKAVPRSVSSTTDGACALCWRCAAADQILCSFVNVTTQPGGKRRM